MIVKKIVLEIENDKIKNGVIYYFFNNKDWVRIIIKNGKYKTIFLNDNENGIKIKKIKENVFFEKKFILKDLKRFIEKKNGYLSIKNKKLFQKGKSDKEIYIYEENGPNEIEDIIYKKVEEVYHENIKKYGKLWVNGFKHYNDEKSKRKRWDWSIEYGKVAQNILNKIYENKSVNLNNEIKEDVIYLIEILISETLIETESHFMFTSQFLTESLYMADLSEKTNKKKIEFLKKSIILNYERSLNGEENKEKTIQLFEYYWRIFYAIVDNGIKDLVKKGKK